MMNFSNRLVIIILVAVLPGCSHVPSWLSGDGTFSMAPVRTAVSVNSHIYKLLREEWDKVYSALAGEDLPAQNKLLDELGENEEIPVSEIDIMRGLLLALGKAEINDMTLAVSLVSKHETKQLVLSPQARFAITIIKNKENEIIQMDALNSKLNALKTIEESMMRRGQ